MPAMQAIILKDFGGVENFELREVALPSVKEGFLLVQIKAVSFNPIDYQIRKGLSESKLLHSPILGREFSGNVVGGEYAKYGFEEGEAVYGYVGSLGSNGTYAEYVSLPACIIAKKPKGVTYEEAAVIPLVGLTALQCLERLRVPQDASVFVSGGAGGVGGLLIKLLLASGVQRLYATAGNEESRRMLLLIGLTEKQILNYREADLLQQAQSRNGEAFHFCIDMVGGTMSEVCAELLKTHGVYADITFQGTPLSREILFDKGATIYNISNYAVALDKEPGAIATYGQNLSCLTQMIETGIIAPPSISVVGPLHVETVRTAHTLLEANESKGKKLVMQIS
jgi:NADPH:quinone reductase-like Zn-dependent oxidoreductase